MDDSGQSPAGILPLGFLACLAIRKPDEPKTLLGNVNCEFAGRNGAPTNKSLAKYLASIGDWCRAH